MSHVGHPTLSTRSQLRTHWIVAVLALAALLAAVAVVLALVIDDHASTPTTRSAAPQAARPKLSPIEAARAALVGQGAGPYQPASEGPDQSAITGSTSGR